MSFVHFVFIFPHSELLLGRFKSWAKKSCRKGRETVSLLTVDAEGVSCICSGLCGAAGGATSRRNRCAGVSFKSSFSVVQVCHSGITGKPISDNVREYRSKDKDRSVHRAVHPMPVSQGHRKPSGWED